MEVSADDEGETRATVGSTLPHGPGEASDAPRLATFDRPVERFELGEELGRGGMGRVVAATDVSLARSVAIKQVLSDRPDDLVRFEREVRITAELEHPSIVPIHEAARDAEGRPYYVMRRIEGDPLTARLSGDLRSRLALLPNLLAVVDAAAFAHARHIIHRDIKPSNILLGAYGETHLIDWGLARRLDDVDVGGQAASPLDQLTQAGHIYGTVGYMAPEQARGEAVDTRADVYALGATLFHVVAGHPPFAHLSQAERLAAAVTGDDQVPLDNLDDDLPPELLAIVDKAMQRDRTARYAHAGELAADLRAFLGGQLVGAHRYTTGQRLRRFVRRHRFAVALTVASLVVVAIISGVALSRIIEGRAIAVRAQENAEDQRRVALARADSLLIERAGSLASSDPTRAAALMLTLRADTPHQERARDAVAKIAAFGITRGASGHTKQINGIAISPNGAAIASVGADGLVVRYDVATGRKTTLVNLRATLNTVEWIDDRTLLVASSELGGSRLVDVQTGTARAFGAAMTSWWRAGDRLRYLHQTTIYELPIAGGVARELARDVSGVVGQGEVALYTTPEGVFALDGYETRRLREPFNALAMTISPDGKRAAASSRTETLEWEIATAKQTQRWPVGTLLWIDYAPQGLVMPASASQLDVLYPNGAIGQHSYKIAPMWRARVEAGLVMVNDVGEIIVLDIAGFHTIDQHHIGTRGIAARADRRVLALGSRDGSIRWLDLSTVAPRPLAFRSTFGVCAVTNNYIFALSADGIAALDLRTHEQRTFTSAGPDMNLGIDCTPTFGNRMIAYSPLGITIVDLVRDSLASVPGASLPAIDADRALYGLGNALFELTPDRAEGQQIYLAPTKIEGVATADQWILMLLANKRLVRLDRSTGAIDQLDVTSSIATYGVRPDGSAWLVQRGVLLMWNGLTIRAIAVFKRDIQAVVPHAERFFVRLSDGSVWDTADGTPQQRVPEGIRDIVFANRGVALSKSSHQITTHYMLSGESVTRDFISGSAVPFADGRGIMLRGVDWAAIFRDEVPDGFVAAKAWLERVTNARMTDETSAMSWQ